MENRKIGKKVKCLSNLLKRRFDSSEVLNRSRSMTGMHGWVIVYLYENRDHDVFQRDVENTFEIRRPTATGILQLMEKNGLIEKSPVSYDQRLKKLTLTPEAIRIHEAVIAEMRAIEEQLCQGLSEEEINAFLRTLDVMPKNMQ